MDIAAIKQVRVEVFRGFFSVQKKAFAVELRNWVKGCCCYPRVSTCILVITLPLHINSDIEMKQVMETALEGDVGFGQV